MAQVLRSSAEITDQNSILTEWYGAEAEVWIFHLTFRRLAILLRFPEKSEVLYVGCLGCRHINGAFRWSNAKLAISDSAQTSGEGTNVFTIRTANLNWFALVASCCTSLRGS